eukprot:GFUD01041502.1.p1 GENE.GFUD01041502.1~~GFUD01041502.1.p1  ORF type:complete len:823 (+),score=239.66 GFUD01041502.1:63-2531(+)
MEVNDTIKSPQKRDWQPGEVIEENSAKKQKLNNQSDNIQREEFLHLNDDSNIGNESDSDLDYDDLDDIVVPSDNDDFMDDDGLVDEDDQSVHSTATTVSDSSACSNTPSLTGESLEATQGSQDAAKRKHAWISQTPNLTDSPALRQSLFSHIPPTINFMLHNEMSAHQLHEELRKHLKWKLSAITPAIVKRCASNSGFRLMRKNCTDWTCTWGRHMKSPMFKEIKESQKINHFPGTFNIGRKDRLWKNYHKLMLKHGKSEFGFLPRTFCLPADTKLLRKVWERKGGKGRWIVKPPALARGEGIKVINKWSQIPATRPLVVQRYVARPYLINETKFDLRLYVLVTSMNPLRIYLYDDGLVRFASNKYTNESSKVHDVFTHLTNYSINKKSASYLSNETSSEAQGHKWTLKTLWRHFDAEGIDHSVIWEKIKDLMIKTIISAESSMVNLFQNNVASRYSCFELFGFDILLDSRLKPWLIEVNISPSLHSSSSLDLDVKSPLATEVFNMARYHIPNKIRVKEQMEIAEKMGYGNITNLCFDRRLYIKEISKAERSKQESYLQVASSSDSSLPPMGLLDHLTPDDCRQLVLSEDELATSHRFARIFPTDQTHKYFRFLEKPRYHNLLLSAWEQRYNGINREAGRAVLEGLCLGKHHLKVPANVYVKKTALGQQNIDISGLEAPQDVPSINGDKFGSNGTSSTTSSQLSQEYICTTSSESSQDSSNCLSEPVCVLNSSVKELAVNGKDSSKESKLCNQSSLKVKSNPEPEEVQVGCNDGKNVASEMYGNTQIKKNGSSEIEKNGNSDVHIEPVLQSTPVNSLTKGVL